LPCPILGPVYIVVTAATNREAKIGASPRVAAKIGLWCVESLDRVPDTLLGFLLP
jgi:hypothetical protein